MSKRIEKKNLLRKLFFEEAVDSKGKEKSRNYLNFFEDMSGTEVDYDFLFKILIVGESGVGKSCLLLRFADDTFTESFISTIGVDFKIKRITMNDKNGNPKTLKLQIWDTAGQDRFRTITTSYYRGAHGILLTYDVTDPNSFLKIRSWLEEIKEHAPEHTVVMLIGNKADKTDKRAVEQKEAQSLADKLNLKYLETSAKTGTGVSDVFMTLTEEMLRVSIENGIKPEPHPRPGPQPSPSGCKC